MAMISMRVNQFYKKTRRKLEFNRKEPVGFDKNKVECFNCHRRGHFARDCRSARNSGNKSKDAGNAGYIGRYNGKRPAKEENEQALVVQDGLGYDSQFKEKEVLDIKEEEVTETVFDNPSSDEENSIANDMFKKGVGYHAVPPPLTRNYIPPKPDLMAKQSVLPTNVGKGTGHRESRPVWNNVQRIDHQKNFALTVVFTRSGRIPVSVAKPKAAASTSTAKPVNTTGHKKVNTAGSKAVSAVKENRVTAVKTSAGHPQQALKNKGIVDSGCSRHMTRNKAYLAYYQKIHDGGFVAFVSSRDSLLPVTFWAEAVNTACYVLNRALVTKTHNKTPYELLNGRSPRLYFMRPFGYPVTILKGKFEGNQTDKNEDPQDTNGNAGTQDNVDAGKEVSDQHYIVLPLWSSISSTYKSLDDKPADDKPMDDTGSKTTKEPVNKEDQAYRDELDRLMSQEKEASDAADAIRKEFEQRCMDQRGVTQAGSTNSFNTISNLVNAASTLGNFSAGGPSSPHLDAFIPANTILNVDQDDSHIPDLEETAELQSTSNFNSAYDDDLGIYTSPDQSVGAEADFNNIESSSIVSHIPTHKLHIDHPKDQILRDPKLAVQTRGMTKKSSRAHALVSYIHKQRRTNHKDYENCLFACFLSQMEPKKCKKQTIVATSTTKAEYVAAAHCCVHVLWIQNQMLDHGFNFMNTKCKKQTIVATSTTKAEYVAAAHCCVQEISSGDRPRRQKTILGGADAQTRFETASKCSSDPHLLIGHIVRSGEDRMEQETDLIDLVLALEEANTTQDKVITRLKLRVRRLEKKRKPRTSQPIKRRLFKGRVKTSTNKSLEDKGSGEKGSSTADQVSTAKPEVPLTTTTIVSDEDLTIAQTLINMRKQEMYTIKERARLLAEYFERRKKQLVVERAKAIRNKPPTRTQVRNMMITYLKRMGKYTHQKLKHKTLEELQMLYEREKKWIDDFVPMDFEKEEKKSVESKTKSNEEESADYEQENEELRTWLIVVSDEEKIVDLEILSTKYPIVDWESQILWNVDMEDKHIYKITRANGNTSYHKSLSKRARLLAEYFERRKKQLVVERAEAIRNKPPTRTQVRNMMITYLKRMAKSNEEESADYEQENEELRTWLIVVSDEEEIMDLEILSTKYPIVDWESQILWNVNMEDKHIYKITRANGNTSYHKSLSKKRYPLIKEMLEKMLNWKLEAEAKSTMAFELLKFIKSQIEE
nr:putative ribonuclease H-like domain-containing protein [Tanacetum cinerariifolium]